MTGDRVEVVRVVSPERARKLRAAEIVHDGFDAAAHVDAAFDEVAAELHAVISGAGEYVAPPGNRLVSFVRYVALQRVAKSDVFERRIVAVPRKKIVAEVKAWRH